MLGGGCSGVQSPMRTAAARLCPAIGGRIHTVLAVRDSVPVPALSGDGPLPSRLPHRVPPPCLEHPGPVAPLSPWPF